MSLLPATRGRQVLAVVGIGGVCLAATLRVAPGVLPAAVRRPLVGAVSAVPAEPILWVLGGVAGLYALVRIAMGRREPAASPTFGAGEEDDADEAKGRASEATPGPDRPGPDRPGPRDGVPTVGTGFDRTVSFVASGVEDPREAGRPVRERLRATATAVLARRTGASPDAAREAIAAGEWTDDRVAAAFLGGESAPTYTLGERLRGWARPEPTFRERVGRTVAAIEAVEGTDGEGSG